jgi:hypothetical protein
MTRIEQRLASLALTLPPPQDVVLRFPRRQVARYSALVSGRGSRPAAR